MSDWLRDYLAQKEIQPLLADLKSGRIRPAAVMLAIQRLTDEERRTMKAALDLVVETLREIDNTGA